MCSTHARPNLILLMPDPTLLMPDPTLKTIHTKPPRYPKNSRTLDLHTRKTSQTLHHSSPYLGDQLAMHLKLGKSYL